MNGADAYIVIAAEYPVSNHHHDGKLQISVETFRLLPSVEPHHHIGQFIALGIHNGDLQW